MLYYLYMTTVLRPDPMTQIWTATAGSESNAEDVEVLTCRAKEVLKETNLDSIQLWIEAVDSQRHETAITAGAVPYRDLWQMRTELPVRYEAATTRAFTEDDIDEFIKVNNRAFAWHPEQSGFDRDRVTYMMFEPWFQSEGFRILEIEGRMAGFNWTKIHYSPPSSPTCTYCVADAANAAAGEVFVVGLDPDFHGQGLGKPLTVAGLDWIYNEGHKTIGIDEPISSGFLYVESDNEAAVATYKKLGFEHNQTNRAYRITLEDHSANSSDCNRQR